MGLQAVVPKRRMTRSNPDHKVYPYLLRNVPITRVDQVWSADITYVPMNQGFMYLVAILDWFSRYVLSWQLSNTLDNNFCLKALERALEHREPEIFNTDQGVQFTSHSFTERLESAEVKISMDGRGRVFDNIFIERLWRTVKYEDIYLKNYAMAMELEQGLGQYFQFYNNERFHQSLNLPFAQAFSKSLVTERQLRSIMIVKELQIQMVNDPPYFCQFLVLTMGVTILRYSYRTVSYTHLTLPTSDLV